MGILELGSLQLTLFAMMLIGVLYTSIFLIPMCIVMWSVGTTYFVAGETVEKKKLIKNVLTHPCLVAIYLGLLCMVTQVQLPSVILNTVKYIGNCNSALTMFIVGTILTLVQVSIRAGSHNCVVSRFGGSDTTFHTTPGHHCCIGRESAFQDFIPTDDIPSFAVEIFLHAGDEVALQLFFLCMFLTVNGIRSGIIFQT